MQQLKFFQEKQPLVQVYLYTFICKTSTAFDEKCNHCIPKDRTTTLLKGKIDLVIKFPL